MIIECINCNKKFEVNSDLIPSKGRTMQCGSCNHVWFYKKQEQILHSEIREKNFKTKDNLKSVTEKINKTEKKPNDKALVKYQKKEGLTLGRIFRYILVFILTFIALIVLLDTLKLPLSNIFPDLEFILFNLYETIRDITLFFKDLI